MLTASLSGPGIDAISARTSSKGRPEAETDMVRAFWCWHGQGWHVAPLLAPGGVAKRHGPCYSLVPCAVQSRACGKRPEQEAPNQMDAGKP